jgi:hypothetical protein
MGVPLADARLPPTGFSVPQFCGPVWPPFQLRRGQVFQWRRGLRLQASEAAILIMAKTLGEQAVSAPSSL